MIVKSYVDYLKLINWVIKQDKISYDLETRPKLISEPETAVKPRKGEVIGIALSNGSESFYVIHQQWNSKEFVQYLEKSLVVKLVELLKSKKLIGFNSSFDVRFSRHYFGVDLATSIWSEVQVARHTSDENLDPWKSLKQIAMDTYGESAGQEQRDLTESIIRNGGKPGHVWLGDLELVAKYAMQDAQLTYKLNEHFLSSIEQQGLTEFYFEKEVMPLYRHVTIDLEDVGIKLDMPLLLKTQEELSQEISALESQIRTQIEPHLSSFNAWFLNQSYPVSRAGGFAQGAAEYYNANLPKTKGGNYSFAKKAVESLDDGIFKRFMLGIEALPYDAVIEIQSRLQGREPAFNLQSKAHWKKVFFEELEETPLSYTEETKQPQCDDDFLESIKHKYNFVHLLLDFNKLNKLKSTYVDRFIDRAEDGRFYSRYGQHTTTTARFSGDIQQLPRRKNEEEIPSPVVLKYTNRIRDFFIADEDRVLVGADYNSLEVVIFADDAGDEPLLNMIRHNKDFYSEVAIGALGLSEYSSDKKAPNFLKIHKPNLRQDAKVYGLGLRYGMESYKLSKTLGISESEAKQIMQNYFNSYPMLKRRMEQLKTEARINGFVKSKAGRIRHLPMIKKLHAAYGDIFEHSLKLYEKYKDNTAKYEQMKFLKGKYLQDLRSALNYPIQSMAASIVNAASIAINKEFKAQGLGALVCMNIHDELVVDCHKTEVEKVVDIMREKMQNTTKLSVPLIAEPCVGTRYSELK